MTERPPPAGHPEAALILRARRARRMNVADAAAAAGISHQRWGQIERGEGKAAPPDTIAHMAFAVGITADRLRAVRPEAADYLEEIELQAAAGTADFERKARAMIASLPEDVRGTAEELFNKFMQSRELGEEQMERTLHLLAERGGGSAN
ncbi:hypothetical protein ACFVH6_22330 [Spirillospora sp. NPDC127200]